MHCILNVSIDMVGVYVYLMVRVSVGEGSLYFHGTIAYMVGAAVYGWGKVGRGKVGRTNAIRQKT